jgi:hypothetical protein
MPRLPYGMRGCVELYGHLRVLIALHEPPEELALAGGHRGQQVCHLTGGEGRQPGVAALLSLVRVPPPLFFRQSTQMLLDRPPQGSPKVGQRGLELAPVGHDLEGGRMHQGFRVRGFQAMNR